MPTLIEGDRALGGQRGAVSVVLAAVLAAAALGGAGVGVAIEQTGVIGGNDSSPTVAGVQSASYSECPGGATVGVLHSGDRVLVTGRDKSSDWVEVRSPADLGARVWLPAAYVAPDADLGGVPVHSCTPITASPSTSTTTTTTAPAAEEPETPAVTQPGATLPAGGGSTGGGSTGGGSTGGGGTPSPPGDTTGPQIAQENVSPGTIWESKNGGDCPGGSFPGLAKVSAIVADPSGVASVTVSWDGAEGGSSAMTGSGNSYSVVVGRFSQNLVSGPPFEFSKTLTVTITAQDGAGNVSTRTLPLTVGNCLA